MELILFPDIYNKQKINMKTMKDNKEKAGKVIMDLMNNECIVYGSISKISSFGSTGCNIDNEILEEGIDKYDLEKICSSLIQNQIAFTLNFDDNECTPDEWNITIK